jgi:hypothetical protein
MPLIIETIEMTTRAVCNCASVIGDSSGKIPASPNKKIDPPISKKPILDLERITQALTMLFSFGQIYSAASLGS